MAVRPVAMRCLINKTKIIANMINVTTVGFNIAPPHIILTSKKHRRGMDSPLACRLMCIS